MKTDIFIYLFAWSFVNNCSQAVMFYNNMLIEIFWSFIKIQISDTSSDYQWQRVVQRVTTNDNEWQQVTTSGATSDKEWQRVIQRVTSSDSEWQEWYNQWKRHSTLQRMDDCRPFNDKNRYATTSRDGWLQLEWLNK